MIEHKHIINILSGNRSLTNAMNIVSFVNDGIVFTAGVDLPIDIWYGQFLKYLKIVMPYSGYTIKYNNPYKSEKLKNITEFEVFKNRAFIASDARFNREEAELSAYIEIIIQKPSFDTLYQEYFKKVEPIVDMIPKHSLRTEKTSSGYKVSDDLRYILDDKVLLRTYKLSLIDI